MSEVQSFLFDFKRVEDFWEMWNIKFPISEMGSSNKFQLVFCTDSPNNIEDCLTNGSLNSNVTIYTSKDCTLEWSNHTISIKDDVTWNIGDYEVTLKAVFLRNKATGYVMGYNINIDNFDITNKLVFDGGTLLWSIHDAE